MIKVKRIQLDTEHDNQKWLVIQAYVDGRPELTKTRAINRASLADGTLTVEGQMAELISVVDEYMKRTEVNPNDDEIQEIWNRIVNP